MFAHQMASRAWCGGIRPLSTSTTVIAGAASTVTGRTSDRWGIVPGRESPARHRVGVAADRTRVTVSPTLIRLADDPVGPDHGGRQLLARQRLHRVAPQRCNMERHPESLPKVREHR